MNLFRTILINLRQNSSRFLKSKYFQNRSRYYVCDFSAKLAVATYIIRYTGIGVVNLSSDKLDSMSSNELEKPSKECQNLGEEIMKLIDMIQLNISEISKQYRSCLIQQMKILEMGNAMWNSDVHWDDLIKYRVEAQNLKIELLEYLFLIDHVQKLIQEIDAFDIKSEIYGRMENLEIVREEQFILNYNCERQLLTLNVSSILTAK